MKVDTCKCQKYRFKQLLGREGTVCCSSEIFLQLIHAGAELSSGGPIDFALYCSSYQTRT